MENNFQLIKNELSGTDGPEKESSKILKRIIKLIDSDWEPQKVRPVQLKRII